MSTKSVTDLGQVYNKRCKFLIGYPYNAEPVSLTAVYKFQINHILLNQFKGVLL